MPALAFPAAVLDLARGEREMGILPDVETFLGGLGLEGYAPAFAENAIDAETLLEITHSWGFVS